MGLVVTRVVEESVSIGPDITVMVIRVKGGQVKLLIKAPEHIRIDRINKDGECEGNRNG